MSTFVDKSDILESIRENVLDNITTFDDAKFEAAIKFATSLMEGHLNARYDTAAIFNATGNDRNPVILTYCIDIVLYRLHSRINPRKIPKYRKDNYDDAMIWLEGVKGEKVNPPGLPLVTSDDTRSYVQFGGNRKRQNHIE
jgi:phage gp36-like protein